MSIKDNDTVFTRTTDGGIATEYETNCQTKSTCLVQPWKEQI